MSLIGNTKCAGRICAWRGTFRARSSEPQQGLASLYALGALSAERRQAFEAELQSSAELRELVRGLQRAADLLALALPATGLPPELRNKVLRRLWAAGEANRPAAEP